MADAGQLPGAIHNLYPSHQPIGQLHFGSRAMAATRSILKQLLSADWAAASIWQLCNGSQYLVSKQFLSANWVTTYIWQLCNGSRYLAAAKNISKLFPSANQAAGTSFLNGFHPLIRQLPGASHNSGYHLTSANAFGGWAMTSCAGQELQQFN